MNIFAHVEAAIQAALATLAKEGALPSGLDVSAATAEAPRDPAHGDVASNAALALAKAAGMAPRKIAELLKPKLEALPDVIRVDIAGPGFLNIAFAPVVWQRVVPIILAGGRAYGRPNVGRGLKTNVEYVSTNPTGPIHIGHGRGAVVGDSLANLLSYAGFDVTREYYINDAGGQVNILARSAFLRYREALGEDIGAIPEGLYPGDYLKPLGEALAKEHGKKLRRRKEATWLPIVRKAAVDAMMGLIRQELAALDIRHDVFFSEASLTDGRNQVAAGILSLRQKGFIYEGRLEKPKGHDDAEWEDREQTLFKSTAFGDDEDRALMKSDGSYTYFAGDIAYNYDKLERGFTRLIVMLGADHAGYVARLKAAVTALSDGRAECDIKLCQIVKLLRDGKAVTMSKRAGTFVTLREVVEEVGPDAVRFMMLMRRNDAPLDFDLVKVVEQSKDNPVFYVQYAHARTASVFRMAAEAGFAWTPDSPDVREADVALLTDPGELSLIKALAVWPRCVEAAAKAHEPHRIAFYLSDLAAAFHTQWARGNELPQLRFIRPEEKNLTAARLALVAATQRVIVTGLGILGVHAPDAMR